MADPSSAIACLSVKRASSMYTLAEMRVRILVRVCADVTVDVLLAQCSSTACALECNGVVIEEG